ncbi:MAG: hypothetical protein Q4D41_01820 [Prevotellaceae bacterium]|nr:hypothetical protein [Prevotellaceae bacterium]
MKKIILSAIGILLCAQMSAQIQFERLKSIGVTPEELNLQKNYDVSDIIDGYISRESSAATPKKALAHPEGDLKVYSMTLGDYFYYGGYSYSELSGAASNVVMQADTTVWFYNLAPTSLFGWAKGVRTGDDVAISTQKIGEMPLSATGDETVDVYVRYGIVTDEGLALPPEPYHLTIKGDSICSADTAVWLCTFLVKDNVGTLYCLNRKYQMRLENDTETISVPSGIDIQEYSYEYVDENDVTSRILGNVAFNDNEVYFAGLVPDMPDSWIRGEIKGNKIDIVPATQFLGSETGLILDYCGGLYNPTYYYISPIDTLSFYFNDDKSEINIMENGYVLEFNRPLSSLENMFSEFKIVRYDGDKPTVPSAPNHIVHGVEYGDYFYFRIPNCDVDGKYLNKDYLSWRVYVNDELYVFDPKDYIDLTYAQSEFKYMFETTYDFAYSESNDIQLFYLYDENWDHVDIQSIYTVNGVRNESALARYSVANGYEGEVTAINNVEASKSQKVKEEIYSVDGYRKTDLTKGMNIIRSVNENGTVSVRKIFMK